MNSTRKSLPSVFAVAALSAVVLGTACADGRQTDNVEAELWLW